MEIRSCIKPARQDARRLSQIQSGRTRRNEARACQIQPARAQGGREDGALAHFRSVDDIQTKSPVQEFGLIHAEGHQIDVGSFKRASLLSDEKIVNVLQWMIKLWIETFDLAGFFDTSTNELAIDKLHMRRKSSAVDQTLCSEDQTSHMKGRRKRRGSVGNSNRLRRMSLTSVAVTRLMRASTQKKRTLPCRLSAFVEFQESHVAQVEAQLVEIWRANVINTFQDAMQGVLFQHPKSSVLKRLTRRLSLTMVDQMREISIESIDSWVEYIENACALSLDGESEAVALFSSRRVQNDVKPYSPKEIQIGEAAAIIASTHGYTEDPVEISPIFRVRNDSYAHRIASASIHRRVYPNGLKPFFKASLLVRDDGTVGLSPSVAQVENAF